MRLSSKARTTLISYLWLVPSLFLVLTFFGYSLIYAFVISTRSYNLMRADRPFIGVANFIRYLTSSEYWQSLWVTCRFLFIVMALIILLSLAFAQLLKQDIPLRSLFRGFLMTPWILSMLITGFIFTWIFDSQSGILNYLLKLVGLRAVPWLSEPGPAFSLLVISYVWKVYPFGMVVFLAGLQSINDEYYEVAAVDGAGPVRRFVSITVPFLKPQFLVVIVLLSINVFNMIDMVFAITKGGPGVSTRLVSYFMYTTAFTHMEMGYSAAIAISLFFINLILTIIYLRILKPEM